MKPLIGGIVNRSSVTTEQCPSNERENERANICRGSMSNPKSGDDIEEREKKKKKKEKNRDCTEETIANITRG